MRDPNLDTAAIRAWCVRWGVTTAWLFGSSVDGEAVEPNDADLMIVAPHGGRPPTLDDMRARREEASAIFGRPAQVVSTNGFRLSPVFDESLLGPLQQVYP